jgi:molybdenum cofactor biosynthesis enzyme MoaA
MDEVRRVCTGAYIAGLRSFTFTGGEPLSNPHAREIISTIRREFPDVTLKMTSNIVLLKDDDMAFLDENIDRIRINFQSTNETDFRSIIGVNRLKRLYHLIELIESTRVHICLNYVYQELSKHLLPEIVSYADEHGFEMKVLEMIKYSYNLQYYTPIEEARAYLESIASHREKDYQNDDVYYLHTGGPRIRLCYSHCNINDGRNCRILGELRVSPTMDIYHCMHDGGPMISVTRETDPGAIAHAILEIDRDKGNCPRFEPWRA